MKLTKVVQQCQDHLDCAKYYLERNDEPVTWSNLWLLLEVIIENIPPRYAKLLKETSEADGIRISVNP